MTYLLDVNVLIALVDSLHVNHEAAHGWFKAVQKWATCPVTENAFVRILASPGYPTVSATPSEVVEHLRAIVQRPGHCFLADTTSLRDTDLFAAKWLAGPAQVTDVYLAGLAHRHNVSLATFDRRINTKPLVDAREDLITLIPVTGAKGTTA